MARVTTTKESFLDRLSKSVNAGAQVAQTITQVANAATQRSVQQAGVQNDAERLGLLKQETEARLQEAQLRREDMLQQAKQKQIEFQETGSALYASKIWQASQLDPEDQKNFFEAQKNNILQAAQAAGLNPDERQLEQLFTKRISSISKFVKPIQSDIAALSAAISGPAELMNEQDAASRLAALKQNYAKASAFTGPGDLRFVESQITKFESALEQRKQDRLRVQGNIAEATVRAQNRPERNPGLDMYSKDAMKELRALEKAEPAVNKQRDALLRARSILDKVGTGPIEGQPAAFFAQKVGNQDAQLLESLLQGAGMQSIIDFVGSTGVTAMNTEPERQALMASLPNAKQDTRVLKEVIDRQLAMIEYGRKVKQQMLQYVKENDNTFPPGFQYPEFGTGASAPAPVGASRPAPTGANNPLRSRLKS